MILAYVLYIVFMWKNEEIEKKFYLYAGYIDTYKSRFGKLSTEEEEEDGEENEDENKLTVKEKIRHERYMKIGREGDYRALSDGKWSHNLLCNPLKLMF